MSELIAHKDAAKKNLEDLGRIAGCDPVHKICDLSLLFFISFVKKEGFEMQKYAQMLR